MLIQYYLPLEILNKIEYWCTAQTIVYIPRPNAYAKYFS